MYSEFRPTCGFFGSVIRSFKVFGFTIFTSSAERFEIFDALDVSALLLMLFDMRLIEIEL